MTITQDKFTSKFIEIFLNPSIQVVKIDSFNIKHIDLNFLNSLSNLYYINFKAYSLWCNQFYTHGLFICSFAQLQIFCSYVSFTSSPILCKSYFIFLIQKLQKLKSFKLSLYINPGLPAISTQSTHIKQTYVTLWNNILTKIQAY